MATNTGRIKLGIDFNVNKSGLDQAKKAIQELKTMSKEQIESSGGSILSMSDNAMKSWKNDLGAMRKELDALDKAMEDAFNPKLGIYELEKFNASLKQSGTSAERALATVGAYGKAGETALLDMTTQMLATDRAAKQVHSTFQKLGDTMMNTIRWSITSSAINLVTGSIQSAYNYAVSLDKSLNDIMIVTDKSAEDMERFARSANKAAKSLGASTKDYTGASLIYYQQGLSDEETKARTETTLKAAAVTGQSASVMSEQLTAVWNGYKVSANEAELYVDKLSAVAATTASDLEELSTGMSKVASAANVMGVDVDQLNAQLATIISVTRQAPESVGTALKTVYARMSDIEAGMDTETTLSEYTSQMAKMGVNVLDAQGHLRDMGDVIEEIGFKWNSLNKEQQVSLAQTIAGTRQYNNMMALFDNWGMYEKSLATSMNSAGALAAQHMDYLEGVEAHQEKLRTSTEGLYQSIFKSDEINGVYDALSGIVTLVDELVQAMGGMPGILATIGMLVAKSAKHSIADLVTKHQTNALNQKIYKSQITNGLAITKQLQQEAAVRSGNNEALETTLRLEEAIYSRANNLTDEQWNTLQAGVREYNKLVQQTIDLEKQRDSVADDAKKYWADSKRYTRYSDGDRKPTTLHVHGQAKKYYLADVNDQSPDGKSTQGLQSLKADLEKLKKDLKQAQQKSGKKKTREVADLKKEIEVIEEVIAAAEEENAVHAKSTKTYKELNQAIKDNTATAHDYAQALEKTAKAADNAHKFANIVDSLSTVAFTAQMVSSSVAQLITDLKEGEATFAGVSASILTITGSLASVVAQGAVSIMQARAAKIAAQQVGNAAAEAAAQWTIHWSAATMGASLLITALTTILSAIEANNKANEQAAKDEANRKIKEANAVIELADANQKLTQSYLNTYSEYEKTGNEKEKLLDLAQQLAEAYKDEELQNLALAGSYDALAASIRNKRLIESQQKIDNAREKMVGAKKGLVSSTLTQAGIVSIPGDPSNYGFQEGPGGSFGSAVRGDESNNAQILANTSQFVQINSNGEAQLIIDPYDMTIEQKIQFYHELIKARKLMTPEVRGNQSEIYATVNKIIAEWEPYIETYTEAEDTINQEQTKQAAYKADISNASYSEFVAVRNQTIEDTLTARGIEKGTEEWNKAWSTTAYDVDKIFGEMEGNAPELVQRYQWIQGQKKAGNLSDSIIAGLEEELDISNLDETEFDALSSIDMSQYKGKSAKEIIKAARQKAKEIRAQRLVDSQEGILAESNSRIAELERQENKAAGLDKVAIIQSQNKELDKQIELLEEIQKKTLATNKTNAQQEFIDLANKYGFTHNLKVGVDENWDPMAIYDAIETAVTNGELNAYEADALQKLLFGTVLDSQNQYQEGTDKINALKDAKHSNTLSEFDIKLNVKIDENKAQKEYTDFLRGFTKDDSYIDLVKFDKESFYDAYKSFQDYRTSLTELEQSDADAAYKREKRQEIISAMMQDVNSLLSSRNQLEETYLNYQDAVNNSYEQYLSLIESANGLLEHQATMMELIYGDKAFKHMGNYYAEQVKNSQLVNAINKQRYEQDKADYEGLLAAGLDFSDHQVQDARDKYLASGEAYAASLAETAQNYAEQYNNTIENILDNFTSTMLSEEAIKEWNWSQQVGDMFLDEVDEIYLKSKLSRAFDKAIKESSSVKAQQALNKAREEELKLLKEKDKLTQYDLDRAQKRLDIEIARLALEDARDAKTKMRLMRGADGTYSYQYVADQSAIDEKQSQYEEALKSRYDADETELQNQVNKSNELLNNMKEEIAALNPASETYEQDLQAIKEKYLPLLQAQGTNVSRVASNLESSSQDLSTLYGTDVISPLLNSQALQSIIAWGSEDQSGLEQMFTNITDAQTTAAAGIANSADTLKTMTDQLYLAIMGREDDLSTSEGESVKDLLDAQEQQVEKLGQMNTAMTGVVTTLGLLDAAIKIAKGDVESDSNAKTLTDLYDVAISEAGVVTMTKKAAAYDTGGYTGAWGSEGKFLLAHEKELILNKADTQNILAAVDIVRSLSNSMLSTVSGMGRGYDLPMAAWELAKDFIIEQTVYINAEFPEASDRSEIEAAFEELMLLATQHAFDSTKG